MDSYGISTIVTTLLGSVFGGGITYLITIKSQKKKANGEADQAIANAKSTEIDNVKEAIAVWKQMAEDLKHERDELVKEIKSLKCQNRTIIKLLKTITPENKADVIAEIENKISE